MPPNVDIRDYEQLAIPGPRRNEEAVKREIQNALDLAMSRARENN